jgi:hypothetical protein
MVSILDLRFWIFAELTMGANESRQTYVTPTQPSPLKGEGLRLTRSVPGAAEGISLTASFHLTS